MIHIVDSDIFNRSVKLDTCNNNLHILASGEDEDSLRG